MGTQRQMMEYLPSISLSFLQRAWRLSSVQWAVWVVFCIFPLVLTIVAGRQAAVWYLLLQAAQASLADKSAPQFDGESRGRLDFAQRLGPSQDAKDFASGLTALAAEANVQILRISIIETAASADTLGKQEFSVFLRGPYLGQRQLLSETLGRFQAATVRTLRLQRDAVGAVEANVVFTLWNAPLSLERKASRGGASS